jgi:hypothetical protein
MIEEVPSKRPAVRDMKTLSVYHDHDRGPRRAGAGLNAGDRPFQPIGRQSNVSTIKSSITIDIMWQGILGHDAVAERFRADAL